MILIITGTPGTGKTTVARKLAKELDLKYVDLKRLIKKYSLIAGYDNQRKCDIIDPKQVNKIIIGYIKEFKKDKRYKGIVIDSHISHHLPKRCVDVCVAAKCGLKNLDKRLKKRRYNKIKIEENLEAEAFDICRIEAQEKGHNIITVETDKAPDIKKLAKNIKEKATDKR